MSLVEWGIALLLLAVAGWFFISCLRGLLMFPIAAWKNRESLNPGRPDGRWRLLGVACLIGAGVLFLNLLPHILSWLAVPIIALVGFLAFASNLSLGRAKRFEATSAAKSDKKDGRPPVVYLRSFHDDAKVARRIGLASFHVNTEEGELADLVND